MEAPDASGIGQRDWNVRLEYASDPTSDPIASSVVNVIPPSGKWLALAGVLLILAGIGSFMAWRGWQDRQAAALSPEKLKRLPARPEDIEAHGNSARSVLAPDSARLRNAAVPFATGPIAIASPFAFKGSAEDRSQAQRCLSTAVLYEAGDDTRGEKAVAQVILNRVRHAAFPGTVCGVVYQGSQRATGCQFTFTCDGSLRRQMPEAAWRRARDVAERALAGEIDETVGLATHYHTDWVYPYWSPQLRKLARVGTHLFFGWPGGWGGPNAFQRKYRGNEATFETPANAGLTVSEAGLLTDPGAPRILGLPQPPVQMPVGLGKVPLYGNRVRLVRPDGRAFGLLTVPDAPASKLVNAALALCTKPGACQVSAWSNEDDIPGEYPISEGARGTMVFEFTRDGTTGKSSLRFDCAIFPNKDTKVCL